MTERLDAVKALHTPERSASGSAAEHAPPALMVRANSGRALPRWLPSPGRLAYSTNFNIRFNS